MTNKNPYPCTNSVQIKLIEAVRKLFAETKLSDRCRYLRKDFRGPYCTSKTKKGQRIDYAQREACDPISLNLYCLNEKACKTCVRYNGKIFRYVYD